MHATAAISFLALGFEKKGCQWGVYVVLPGRVWKAYLKVNKDECR